MHPHQQHQQQDVEAHSSDLLLLSLHAAVWQQLPSKAVVELLRTLTGGGEEAVTPAAQRAVLRVLCSPLCQAAPPGIAYVARLIKQLIGAAEGGGQELDEALLQLQVALLQAASRAAGASDQQHAQDSWRFRTFCYSRQAAWHEVQHLQLQACRRIAAAASSCEAAHDHGQQQQAAAQWVLPAHLQQRLLAQQQALRQLLAAADLLQQQQQPVCCGASSTPPLLEHQAQQHREQASAGCGLVTIHSSDNLFEGGTGCFMWDAGFLLAEFVLNNPDAFAGKRVLEVGCGPGLVATCLCRVGAARVLLTDGDPQTLVNALTNLALNGHRRAAMLGSWHEALPLLQKKLESSAAAAEVLACPLDWHERVPGLGAAVDVVVGSDICYDPAAVPALVQLLQQLLLVGAPPPVAFIATTKRAPTTLQLFLDLAAAAGLQVTELPKEWPVGDGGGGGGCSTPVVESGGGGCTQLPVAFQQLPALPEGGGRERYVLHGVVAAAAGSS